MVECNNGMNVAVVSVGCRRNKNAGFGNKNNQKGREEFIYDAWRKFMVQEDPIFMERGDKLNTRSSQVDFEQNKDNTKM